MRPRIYVARDAWLSKSPRRRPIPTGNEFIHENPTRKDSKVINPCKFRSRDYFNELFTPIFIDIKGTWTLIP